MRSIIISAALAHPTTHLVTKAATHTVEFTSNFFSPDAITVNVGDSVRFVNKGGFHTVTGSANDPFCGNNQVDDSCTVTFNTAGTFPYRCLFHSSEGPNPAGMVGSVTVLAASGEKPNLVPFRLNGWTAPVVLSRAPGSNISDPDFADDQDVWLDWAIANISLTTGITPRFFTEVLVDGVSKASWFHDGLAPDTFNKIEDFKLGKFPLGDHTLRLLTDHTFVVEESNESDNAFDTTFRIFPSTANQHTVLVFNFRFNPSSLTIKKGATVTFQNIEGTHTATGPASDPFCGDNPIAQSCKVTFNKTGRFPFRCLFHSTLEPNGSASGMTGEIVVLDDISVESATTINGPFAQTSATVDYPSRTVKLPLPSRATFWRLNSTVQLRIRSVDLNGANVVLAFD